MRDKITIIVLLTACLALVGYRAHALHRSGGAGVPVRHHELILDMRLFGHGDDVDVKAYLPRETDRQSVRDELVSSGRFAFTMERRDGNRMGIWDRSDAHGPHSLVYSGVVRTGTRRYALAPRIEIPVDYPTEVRRELLPSERIQSDAAEIRALLEELVSPPDRDNATAVLQAAFEHTHRAVDPAAYQGTTDALTCLRLGESSCGGKSRLFVALLRVAGIPARTVGGVILKEGSWSAGHVWAEAFVGGRWVPFCPLNGYFAEVPDRYLSTYVGDLPQFTHTRDINFRYTYTGKRILAPPGDWAVFGWAQTLNAPSLWAAFEQARIPVNLLKIILMIPFGALVVVLARNVVGVETFGTFMPALMAVAFRDTGLLWGTVLFVVVIALGAAVRFGLSRYQLLHTPRLAVILTTVVMAVLALALTGMTTGFMLPTRVSLFPLAILTLTAERFAVLIEEDGARRATGVTLGTLLVVAAAYLVMGWERLEVAVLTFPELLLLVVAAFFATGRWSGMRLLELVRFRELAGSRGNA